MRILVIGGTRWIGAHAVRRLATQGHALTVFHRGETDAGLPAAVERVRGDRRQLASHTKELRRCAPEVVLDMIPLTGEAAAAVQSVFRGVAKRVVSISSMDVYRAYGRLHGTEPGPPEPLPLTEDSLLREQLYPYRARSSGPEDCLYSYDKIPNERVIMSDTGLPATVLRLPAVYGPGDYQRRPFGYLKRMADGRDTILLGERQARWRWARGFVEDIAAAISLAVTDQRAASRVYNVCERDALSEQEWVEALGRASGWRGRVVCLPDQALPAHLHSDLDWSHDLVVDSSRIRRELGWCETTTREEALRRTIEWERTHPPAKLEPKDFDYAAEDAANAVFTTERKR